MVDIVWLKRGRCNNADVNRHRTSMEKAYLLLPSYISVYKCAELPIHSSSVKYTLMGYEKCSFQ